MDDSENQTIVFGGGCFWCTEAVFQRLRGVVSVSSGYSGGHTPNPTYEDVSSGTTGHAEVIRVEYDSGQIPLSVLLDVFFSSHDPTTENRQGADVGTQYRSVIFFTNESQKKEIEKYLSGLRASGTWEDPIVTAIEPLGEFYPAESYHADYYNRNGSQPYCRVVIDPKILKLKKNFSRYLKDNADPQ